MAHSDDQRIDFTSKNSAATGGDCACYKGQGKEQMNTKVNEIMKELKALGINVKYDDNDNARPGWKFAEYEMKGAGKTGIGRTRLAKQCGGSSPPRYQRKTSVFF